MPAPPETSLKRACGGVVFDAVFRDGRTGLGRLRQDSPCRAFFPHRPNEAVLEAILVNTSGGLVEGDRITTSISVGPNARAHVTTQAAEKVYRSMSQICVVDTALKVAGHGVLFWVPRETMLFDGARLARHQSVELAGSARFLAAEVVIFGRIMRGERLNYGQLSDSWSVFRDGRLVWRDALRLDGDLARHWRRLHGFGNAVGHGTIFHHGPDAASLLPLAREIAGRHGGGATLVNGILLCRLLGDNEARLRDAAADLTQSLRAAIGGVQPSDEMFLEKA